MCQNTCTSFFSFSFSSFPPFSPLFLLLFFLFLSSPLLLNKCSPRLALPETRTFSCPLHFLPIVTHVASFLANGQKAPVHFLPMGNSLFSFLANDRRFSAVHFFVLGYVNRGATYLEMKSTRLFKVSNHGLFTLSPCDMRQYLQKDVAYLWRFSNIWRLYYANGMKWMVHDASWLLGIVTLALLTDIAWINCLKVFKYVCI